MNKKLKEQVKKAFTPPPPKRKQEFLISFNYPKESRFDFFATQAGYIRKRTWAASFFLTAAVLIWLYVSQEDITEQLRTVSSFLPFIILAGITELSRSTSHNMAEMEMACKYNLPQIVVVRLCVLGFVNAISFAVILAAFRHIGDIGIIFLITELFTPYLMACCLSLFLFNRLRIKERLYVCGGVACFVGVASYPLEIHRHGIIFIAALFLTAWEIAGLLKRAEENEWNLSLTV